ncbi:hypothetical protein SAMN04487936_106235 [Halobacillus dabanensis]|uniref:Uncharacterized protein n=1 Tax=Halobacillus dabanensis TaxID=240302 RepID=A0A1I3WAH7_HALDA|nr:hypothetical protein [Halobacillus dabanensis]SFK03461.1 hypothetical protein SAMN04487936_106235 [Halobacillus dabanensis]
MEEELEKESTNQQYIRNKARKSVWHLFLLMALCIGFGQIFFGHVPGLFYLGALVFYGFFLYETYMSRKTNEELWSIWEERWEGRQTLFQLRSSLTESFQVFIPVILSADAFAFMSLIFLIIALVTGFRSGTKKWKAKKHYFEEFKKERDKVA